MATKKAKLDLFQKEALEMTDCSEKFHRKMNNVFEQMNDKDYPAEVKMTLNKYFSEVHYILNSKFDLK